MNKFEELKLKYPNLVPVQELRANVSIIDLAMQHGYELHPEKGKSRPVLKHPGYNDTIIIQNPQDPSRQVYQRANDFADSGTVIDFVKNRMNSVFSTFNRPNQHEFKNVTDVLYDHLRIDPNELRKTQRIAERVTEAGPKQPFSQENFDIRTLEPGNYLNQRHIAPAILASPEFKDKVVAQITYFDTAKGHTETFPTARDNPDRKYLQFTNVAFPYYNGQSTDITGLELRSDKVKLHAPGSDRNNSVFISNVPPKVEKVFIMESAIDALSHKQLRAIKGDTAFDSVYFSTGGQLTNQQVNTMGQYMRPFGKDFQVHLAFDNDPKGHRYDLQFIQQLTATRFPLAPTSGGLNRAAFVLPEDDSYKGMRESLLNRVEHFNKNVGAQIVRSDADPLGKKELTSQLILVQQTGKQTVISVPETTAALSMVNRHILELTGFTERVQISKAVTKDFNQDLTREVNLANKFGYAIKDETGEIRLNGNSPIQIARSLHQLKHQAETDGQSKEFTLVKREPFGFQKPQVDVKIVEGQTVKSTQTREFTDAMQMEKKGISEGVRQPKQALNPEDRPVIGQTPPDELKDRQIKPRLG